MARKKSPSLFSVLIMVLVLGFLIASYTQQSDGRLPYFTGHTPDTVQVHFLDVGQADCQIALLPNGEVLMIDAGNNDDAAFICSYIDFLGVERIDYLVGTHPHEDHIGSLDTVIDNYEIGKVYMPRVEYDSSSYYDVIDAIERKGLDPIYTESNMTILYEEDILVEAVAPVKSYYESLNNYSIVLRLTYKSASFLFTGDAEAESEYDITQSISADVLSVGHHGSSTSTTDSFLNRVDPMYAVISCGENNDYGHPHRETLEKLMEDDVTIYRTDLDGTIVCTTAGEGPADYKWESEK